MAKYKVIVPKAGAADKHGTSAKLYPVDEIVDASEDWQEELMQTFMANGWAVEVKVDAPEEAKRARNDKGQLKADDPSTPDVNEAWEGGKAPTKKKTKKKAVAKKKTTKKASK